MVVCTVRTVQYLIGQKIYECASLMAGKEKLIDFRGGV